MRIMLCDGSYYQAMPTREPQPERPAPSHAWAPTLDLAKDTELGKLLRADDGGKRQALTP